MFTQKNTTFVAHRGLQPENTLFAFENAYRSGFLVAECDVHASKDGQIIVCHDETLKRTARSGDATILSKPISECLYSEMQSVTVGDAQHAEPLPLLASILKCIPHGKTLLVEVKHGMLGFSGVLLTLLQPYLEKIIVISFDYEALCQIKKLQPKCRAIFLTVSKDWGRQYTVVNDMASANVATDMIKTARLDGIGLEPSSFITANTIKNHFANLITQVWYVEQDAKKVTAIIQQAVDAEVDFVNVDGLGVLS